MTLRYCAATRDAVIEDFAESGLTQDEYCEERGIRPHQFEQLARAWKRAHGAPLPSAGRRQPRRQPSRAELRRRAAILRAAARSGKTLYHYARTIGHTYAQLDRWRKDLQRRGIRVPAIRVSRRGTHGAAGCPALSLPWDQDPACLEFMEAHPGGGTLEEIAAVYGVSRERIRQIEQSALASLRGAIAAGNVDLHRPDHPAGWPYPEGGA